MSEESENAVLALLRELRATQLEQSAGLRAVEARLQHIEKQLEDLVVEFRQSKQGATFDDLFLELEKILASGKAQ